MNSKTLEAIQTISKIAKVLSAIAYVCCLVGSILCIVGLSCIGIPQGIRVGGVTVYSMIEGLEGFNVGTSYAVLLGGAIFCVAGCVMSKLARNYFENELAAGTPFTIEGSKELMHLGICIAAISFGSTVLAAAGNAAIGKLYTDVIEMSFDASGMILLGLAFIVASLVCKHGAELNNATPAAGC